MAIYPKDLSKESLELNSSLKLFQIYKNLKHVSIKCDTYFQVYEELFILKYHGNWSFMEAYNLPVTIRRWFLQRLTEQFEKENEKMKEAQSKSKSGRR